MAQRQVIQADWTWVDGRFIENCQVVVDARGLIERVGPIEQTPTHRLENRALLPGMVNAHSHAFQRGLRGRGEVFDRASAGSDVEHGDGRAADDDAGPRGLAGRYRRADRCGGADRSGGAEPDGEQDSGPVAGGEDGRPADADVGGDFWSWREAMYDLVSGMDAARFYRLSRRAFEEMRACGITTVGEFHYLRHDASCAGYGLDRVVLEAARDAGIRMVLLAAYYRTGGIGQPLSEAQRRFESVDPRTYWRQTDALVTEIDPALQSLGAVVHSIRAAGVDDLASVHAESRRRGLPFHIHVEEQRREIEDCRTAYGATPMALINERLAVDDRFTAVHCTHTEPDDMARFLRSGGRVCLCPITEANLGDGLADVPGIVGQGGRICIGTDLNARLCMTEELRLLEYGQRLRREARGIVVDDRGRVAAPLFEMATRGGAESLGVRAGVIEPGRVADFAVLDLTAPALDGWSADTLLEAFVFGTGECVVAGTCVGGRWSGKRG